MCKTLRLPFLLYGLVLQFLLLNSIEAQTTQTFITIDRVQDFTVDPFGNCYTMRGGDIVKFNASGKEMVRYSRKDLGTPRSIDATNPLRIHIFYAEFALIRIVDNNLVDQSEINLRELGILQPRVAAATPDQGLWIFDEISGSLLKVDTRLKSTGLSIDLNLLLSRRPQPLSLLANQHWMVMQELDRLILFDQFGAVAGTIMLKNPPRMVELREEELIFEEEGRVVTYSLRLRSTKSDSCLCPQDVTKFHLLEGKCIFLKNGSLHFPH